MRKGPGIDINVYETPDPDGSRIARTARGGFVAILGDGETKLNDPTSRASHCPGLAARALT